MTYTIEADHQTINLSGNLSAYAMRRFCAVLHQVHDLRGYQQIILDFSNAVTVFESFVVPILPIISFYNKIKRVDFLIELPEDQMLKRLFINTNWAHFICPRDYEMSKYSAGRHMPAVQFITGEEQHAAVNDIMEVLLGALEGLDRGHLKALEWSISEVTDNVLNHADSSVGGFVQATTYSEANRVEVIVADAGIGIPKSMNDGQTQESAVRRSIEEGVTRNKKTNRGNGLYGTYQVALLSKGEFEINSQIVSLFSKDDDLRVNKMSIPYNGTSVRFVVDCNEADLLGKALKFKGVPHDPPADYLEMAYEARESEDLTIKISENAQYLASRDSGKILKNKIRNLINSSSHSQKVYVDFSKIFVLSSSVADEVFGQLFKELGPMQFMSRIEIINADSTVRALIDRSIQSRMLDSNDPE